MKSSGAEWFTFYGAKGEKLGIYTLGTGTCTSYYNSYYSIPCSYTLAAQSTSVRFAGRLIMDLGSAVQPDRLGTNRTNYSWFLPYGDGSAGNDRLEFATYTRDSYTGLDYADQRFYASTYGRFNTPDPSRKSARRNSPGSWNRYTYVSDDPVNRQDPSGLLDYSCGLIQDVEGGVCPFDDSDAGAPLGGGYLANAYPADAYPDAYDSDTVLSNENIPGCSVLSAVCDLTASFAMMDDATDVPPCNPASSGFGIGVVAGASAEAGVGIAGATLQGSGGAGVFVNGAGRLSLGGVANTVATAYVGSRTVGAPAQPSTPNVIGAFAGYGPGVFITNAGSAQQLAGPFYTLTVNIGVGVGQASLSFGGSGETWIATATAGPIPVSTGIGGSYSTATTTTAVASTSPCP